MFTQILVGYDQSNHARAALAEAADIARTQNAKLTVLTAYSPFLAWPGVGFGALSQSIYDEVLAASRAEGQGAVDDAVKRLPEGVTAATKLIDAPAAEAILSEVNEGGYDLIVLGSRGSRAEAIRETNSVRAGGIARETPVSRRPVHQTSMTRPPPKMTTKDGTDAVGARARRRVEPRARCGQGMQRRWSNLVAFPPLEDLFGRTALRSA
jgi:nucleotide-binding universal stress UspA family protein